MRIFTPAAELPFAGHPNVGTALVLGARRGRPKRMVFEERAGLVAMTLDWSGAAPTATLEAPVPLQRGRELDAAMVAGCIGLQAVELVTEVHPPCVAGVGTDFVLVQVRGDALGRAAGELSAIRIAAGAEGVPPRFGVLAYAREGDVLRTRIFAPLSGIVEDPATGSANAALTALLLACGSWDRLALTIYQGVEMGRPSLLHAEARRAADGVRARIGGSGVETMRGTLQV